MDEFFDASKDFSAALYAFFDILFFFLTKAPGNPE